MNSNVEILRRVGRVVIMLAVVLGLSSCGGGRSTEFLAAAPNLYTLETGIAYPAEAVPRELRSVVAEILYMTDRNALRDPNGKVTGYGHLRNDSMAFGVAKVRYGGLPDWEALLAQTQQPDGAERNAGRVRLDAEDLREIAEFPATPLPYARDGGRLQATQAARGRYAAQRDRMKAEISARMRRLGMESVLVFVHGFNNEFDDGVGTLANIWHFAGRKSLPVVFSWPAGNDGPLAYFRDVESGDFSIFHVKEFLRILASVPEVKHIDIVAHSRGTDVMTTALRELLIEARGSGRDPQKVMKTGVLILAAADLDAGVARQRLVAERFADAFEQINIYANPQDKALGLSRIIGKVTRLGALDPAKIKPQDLENLSNLQNVSVVLTEGGGVRLGHAYFRENPAVLSDIVLALRTRARAGTALRPLDRLKGDVWVLHQNYPNARLPRSALAPVSATVRR